MMSKLEVVTPISEDNGKMISTSDTLKSALADIGERGALKEGRKVLVIALDDNNEQYTTNFYQAGMSMSQCIALCEVAKSVFLNEMNY